MVMEKCTLEVTTAMENMDTVMSFVEEHSQCIENDKITQQLMIIAEELTLNVFNYAYDGRQGEFILSITHEPEHRWVVMEFRDRGKAYNPLSRLDPDVGVPISERKIGGLGILISKRLTDEQSYVRENGQNVLTVKKNY